MKYKLCEVLGGRKGLRLGLLSVGMLMAGCVTVEVQDVTFNPKIMHFDSPETLGSTGAGMVSLHAETETPEFTLGSVTKVTLGFGGGATTSIDKTVTVHPYSFNYGLRGELGLLENIDVFYAGEGMFGLKVQLLGAAQEAKMKGWKLAVAGSAGQYATENGVSALDVLNLFTSNNLSSKSKVKVQDVSLILGYRLKADKLVYLNTFSQKSTIDASLYDNKQNALYTTKVKSNTQGALLGLRIHTAAGAVLTIEGGIAEVTMPGLDKVVSYPIGLSSGFAW